MFSLDESREKGDSFVEASLKSDDFVIGNARSHGFGSQWKAVNESSKKQEINFLNRPLSARRKRQNSQDSEK